MSIERDLEGWTIAFDLDGTLVDSAPDLIGTLNRMLAEYELPPVPMSSTRHLVGHGAMAMLRHGFMEAGAAWDEPMRPVCSSVSSRTTWLISPMRAARSTAASRRWTA